MASHKRQRDALKHAVAKLDAALHPLKDALEEGLLEGVVDSVELILRRHARRRVDAVDADAKFHLDDPPAADTPVPEETG